MAQESENVKSEETRSNIFHPPRAISRKTLEPILFLADKMASSDEEAVPRETRIIDRMAEAGGMATFRHQPWYRDMTQEGALNRINTDLAKRATLVILTLVLKADVNRKPSEHAYFTYVRESLGAEPITVPVGLEEHMQLALEYIRD